MSIFFFISELLIHSYRQKNKKNFMFFLKFLTLYELKAGEIVPCDKTYVY